MPRLFVALDLPETVTKELARIQPPPVSGLRNVKADQVHLTLHFIGEADIATVAEALAPVSGRKFELTLSGVGKFPPSGKAKVLWVGIRDTAELLSLHAVMGKALGAAGFPIETRPYAPHITLARCGHKVLDSVVDKFLSQNHGFVLPSIPVEGFALYSSRNVDDAPVYFRERWFPFV